MALERRVVSRGSLQLYLRSGEVTEAEGNLVRGSPPRKTTRRGSSSAIDSLLIAREVRETVKALRSPSVWIRKDPADWEAIYREGRALASLDRPAEAARRFEAILDLRHDDDEDGATLARARKSGHRRGSCRRQRPPPRPQPWSLRPFPTAQTSGSSPPAGIRMMLGLQAGTTSAGTAAWGLDSRRLRPGADSGRVLALQPGERRGKARRRGSRGSARAGDRGPETTRGPHATPITSSRSSSSAR